MLGARKKTLAGFSSTTAQPHQVQPLKPWSELRLSGLPHLPTTSSAADVIVRLQGFIYGCVVIQQTPPSLRIRAARLVASKCALLARLDAHGQDPGVSSGRCLLRPAPNMGPTSLQPRGCVVDPVTGRSRGAHARGDSEKD